MEETLALANGCVRWPCFPTPGLQGPVVSAEVFAGTRTGAAALSRWQANDDVPLDKSQSDVLLSSQLLETVTPDGVSRIRWKKPKDLTIRNVWTWKAASPS